MARMARLVVPGYPHHITQRGSRRQQTFFRDDDYRLYLSLLRQRKTEAGVSVWAYCLMPNHVHLVLVPDNANSLSRLLGSVHRRYALAVNKRMDWKGHLWQERFYSFVMDEAHLVAAVRYVELNPVRAGLCRNPLEWPWSSVRAHLTGRSDGVVEVAPMLEQVGDWSEYLASDYGAVAVDDIRRHTSTGRPAGDNSFLSDLEAITQRPLRKQRPGPKPDSDRR